MTASSPISGPIAPGYTPSGDARAAYETHGTSLVRYVARRAAKTRLLLPLGELLRAGSPDRGGDSEPGKALAVFGVYCAASAASYGRGYRQPSFDPVGATVEERDPETGARVVARLEGRGPGDRYRLAVDVELDGVGRFAGHEEILGTTIGLHGLGMPAPSRFAFESDPSLVPWSATAEGTITAELAPGLRSWLVRGHGTLDLADGTGRRGHVTLGRDGQIVAAIEGPGGIVLRGTIAG